MTMHLRTMAAAGGLLIAMSATGPAQAQKSGGILRLQHFDSPASMSILEESTRATEQPMMGVFNNLVLYDQHVAQNSLQSIVPDLATKWEWSEDGKELTFPLRQGVKWHDGKPFTAADVKCTWDLLMGKGSDKLRINPRKSWYSNVVEVTTRGDYEVTFHLKQPQPALLALLASGWSPIYPCHVPAREMRQHPIGTGPFKFVEFKPNEYIKVTRNPDYWKKDRPYLDGIEYTIMRETGPRNLAFFAGKFDAIPLGVTIPTLKDFKEQAPKAICQVNVGNVPRTMLINLHKPPFDNPELRRAMVLSLDRKAFVDIINEGVGNHRRDHAAAARRRLGHAAGGAEDAARLWRRCCQEPRRSPQDHGKARLWTGQAARHQDLDAQLSRLARPGGNPGLAAEGNLYRRRARICRYRALVSPRWRARTSRSARCRSRAASMTRTRCSTRISTRGAERNYAGYSDPEFDKLVDQQSMQSDPEKRKQIVWQAERKLAEAAFRPVIYYPAGASCRQPWVKGWTRMTNSIYNEWRFEDVWLDK